MQGFGQKSIHWLYFAFGVLVSGALVRIGWEIGGKIWVMM